MKIKIIEILNRKIDLKTKTKFFQPNILSNNWNEEVFKNHNKEYGAYQLRIHYQNNISKALVISFSVVILIFMLLFLLRNNDRSMFINAVSPITISPGKIDFPPTAPKKINPPIKTKQVDKAQFILTKDISDNNSPKENLNTDKKNGNGIDTSEFQSTEDGNGKISDNGNKKVFNEIKNDSAVLWAPEMPEFPGGIDGLNKYISNKVRTNNQWRENGFDGKIIYEFVFGQDGNIRELKIYKDGVNYGVAELNLSIFNYMPLWKPGKNNGREVSVLMHLPIKLVKE